MNKKKKKEIILIEDEKSQMKIEDSAKH